MSWSWAVPGSLEESNNGHGQGRLKRTIGHEKVGQNCLQLVGTDVRGQEPKLSPEVSITTLGGAASDVDLSPVANADLFRLYHYRQSLPVLVGRPQD